MAKRSWTDMESERINEQITRRMFWGEKIMVTRWELAPDTTIPLHDHVSEQVTMVEAGSLTLLFGDGEEVGLSTGEMIVIASGRPHGVKIGPEGCTAVDIFSPIREDFLSNKPTWRLTEKEPNAGEEVYVKLQGYLTAKGIHVPLEKLKELPVELLARYVYEKECITMGELRGILGLDKAQAKALLRQWKHGDDHSESSLRRKLERLVIMPWEAAQKTKR
ncbi:MAG: cupin domain-containing protein [Thermodesulfobacteriota bacterium]